MGSGARAAALAPGLRWAGPCPPPGLWAPHFPGPGALPRARSFLSSGGAASRVSRASCRRSGLRGAVRTHVSCRASTSELFSLGLIFFFFFLIWHPFFLFPLVVFLSFSLLSPLNYLPCSSFFSTFATHVVRPKPCPQMVFDTAYLQLCGCVCLCCVWVRVWARKREREGWGGVPSRCGGSAFPGKEQCCLPLDPRTRWEEALNLVHWAAIRAQVVLGGTLAGRMMFWGQARLCPLRLLPSQAAISEVPGLGDTHVWLFSRPSLSITCVRCRKASGSLQNGFRELASPKISAPVFESCCGCS